MVLVWCVVLRVVRDLNPLVGSFAPSLSAYAMTMSFPAFNQLCLKLRSFNSNTLWKSSYLTSHSLIPRRSRRN